MIGGMRRDCGVCRGTGKLGYSYKVYDAEVAYKALAKKAAAKDDQEPIMCEECGRREADGQDPLSHSFLCAACAKRLGVKVQDDFKSVERGRKKPEAKDQVPQDCFDAQILGV
jgi:hypothetical protein